MPLDSAFPIEVQANGGAVDAHSGGPSDSFMPKLGIRPLPANPLGRGGGGSRQERRCPSLQRRR
jgi:hypothetical protein